MTAMMLKVVLCFFLGFFCVSSAERQYQLQFVEKAADHYPHAGRVDVFIDGGWGTICASDWDMNDAEVVCRELGKGSPNSINVIGGPPAGNGTECLSRVKCYGHESLLSECEVTKTTRTSSTNDKGIVCYPPQRDSGLRIRFGPDQYSSYVEVKVASGGWSKFVWYYGYDYHGYWSGFQYISNICRQLKFGELK